MLTKFVLTSLAGLTLLAATGPVGAAANLTYVTYTQTQVAGGFGLVTSEAVDTGGNVYIVATAAGTPNGQVWKETPASGTYSQTAITTAATGPQGIAVDAQGDLFISDYVTNSIFKETVTGSGYTESTVVSGFSDPYAMAVDASGNLYVLDARANTLLKETLSGGVYTQSLISSALNQAAEVTVDGSGNVYVADAGNNRVLKETFANGTYTESTIGTGLNYPQGVALDPSGVVYIADTHNNRLLSETPQNGSYLQAVFQANVTANSINFDSNGSFYYAAQSSVYKSMPNELAEAAATNFGSASVAGAPVTQSVTFTFDAGGALASTPYFVSTQGDPQLDFVASATQASDACVAGRTYAIGTTCTVSVAFSPTHPGWRYGAVALYGPAGVPVGTAYLQGTGTAPQVNFSPGTIWNLTAEDGQFVNGVATDSAGNAVYVDSVAGTNTLSYANLNRLSAPVPTLIEEYSNGSTAGVGIDGAGNLFAVDADGTVTELQLTQSAAGAPKPYDVVGNPTFSDFSGANVAVTTDAAKIDGSGNVFIGSGNRAGGAVSATSTAFLESFAHGGYAQTSLGSGLNNTTGLAVDGNGAVYLLDQGNARIVKETPAGGSFTQSVLFTALNSSNTDIAVDGLGNLYMPNGSTVLKQTLANGSYTASTLALNGLGPDGRINAGAGYIANGSMVVDGSGNVLFTQSTGNLTTLTIRLNLLDFSDAPMINFATTAVGATSSDSPYKLSIVNNGNATLTFAAPPTAEHPAITAGFTLSSNTTCPLLPGSTASLSLAPGASCDMYINFTPVSAGAITGTLTVTDNSLNAPGTTQVIQLNGGATGTSTPAPSVALTPASSNYGTVTIGSSGSATLTLTNTGTVSVAVASASVSSSQFTVASTTCANTLSAGANCTYTVNFAPTAAGVAAGTFSVTDDAGTQTTTLSGTGAAVSTGTGTANDFGITASPPAQIITAGNSASYSVDITSISGTFSDAVTLSASGLPAGATVTFAPASVTPGAAGATSTMTIQTATLAARTTISSPWPLGAPFLAAALFIPFGLRRPASKLTYLMVIAVVTASLPGCGGGFAVPQIQSQPQVYTVTLSGTSGSLQHSVTVQLTVK